MSLLEVHEVDAHYGAIHALRKVSLTVEAGEVVTLIGSNGAGKSTTLRVLSGLLKPTSGRVLYDGQSLVGRAPHEIVRMGLAHAPEGRGIFGTMTVRENLELGAFSRSDRQAIKNDVDKMMVRFPILAERAGQAAGTLSGGEQQMLAVARALMARPKLLLLDEPSLGLAPQVVQKIFQIIREVSEGGVTILLVEQNATMALGVANRGYVLESGEIKMSDDAKALAASDAVRKAYLGVG
jgi:branched-chain amino acid transport system ATP-binding protein